MRLLHPGIRGGGRRAVPTQPDTVPGRDRRGTGREHLPLHGLWGDHPGVRGPGGKGGTMTARTHRETRVVGGIGESPIRPDGVPKLRGEFQYAQDLYAEGMLWGYTVRSPHARARIRSIDIAPALAIGGVHAVLTQDDVPGRRLFGLEHPDQPVLADGEVRYWGEPVAIVAAEDRETARRAAEAVTVEYEELEPLTDPEAADAADEVFRRMRIRRGDPQARGSVVVEGYYEVGMQDQAPLGTEAGLAVPDGSGGVDLYATSQFVHVDHQQVV